VERPGGSAEVRSTHHERVPLRVGCVRPRCRWGRLRPPYEAGAMDHE